jgi:hypothetical protein
MIVCASQAVFTSVTFCSQITISLAVLFVQKVFEDD